MMIDLLHLLIANENKCLLYHITWEENSTTVSTIWAIVAIAAFDLLWWYLCFTMQLINNCVYRFIANVFLPLGSGQIQLWQFLLELLSDSSNAGTILIIILAAPFRLTWFTFGVFFLNIWLCLLVWFVRDASSGNNMGRHKRRIQVNRSGRGSQTMGRTQVEAKHELWQIKSRIEVILLIKEYSGVRFVGRFVIEHDSARESMSIGYDINYSYARPHLSQSFDASTVSHRLRAMWLPIFRRLFSQTFRVQQAKCNRYCRLVHIFEPNWPEIIPKRYLKWRIDLVHPTLIYCLRARKRIGID